MVAGGLGGRQVAFCEVDPLGIGVIGSIRFAICVRVLAGGCRRRVAAIGCRWARVTDVAKRRRQEL